MSNIFDKRKPTMTREQILASVNAPVISRGPISERTDDIAPIEQYEMPVSHITGKYVDEDGNERAIRNISFLK